MITNQPLFANTRDKDLRGSAIYEHGKIHGRQRPTCKPCGHCSFCPYLFLPKEGELAEDPLTEYNKQKK